ncbi:MAG: cytochrome P450 [Bacillota bacterium]|uniref:Cytochrome P450 n=1 Tax=Virgibacillus salarius TaxID=447199 RepID=A0A941DUW3_9BACI|nr:cytochrome P450 [Virgibacillus salarius]MBR7795937.1 cytochrome P450 [Virgibacillus salarius]NAZ08649.1 cytochrome P450 [Agaribacter marinus]WBX78688.1 cytochrome P450 [Virgibacillus salarius]
MSNRSQIPREEGIDHTLSLIREGYRYILNRRQIFSCDIFETRLVGKKAICMGGKEAAEIFYDNEKFKRKDAAPNRAVQTLFGKNGVQALDGQAHRQRKEMFMSIMSSNELDRLTGIIRKQWKLAVDKWVQMDKVIFYEEVKEIMCRTACEWISIPVSANKVKGVTKDLGAMFESVAAIGPTHWLGRNARNRIEKWVGKLVEEIRDGKVNVSENSILYKFIRYHDPYGNSLDTDTVAVEVINILRPLVAIAIFINFIALTVYHYPNETKKLERSDEKYSLKFIQEVRRFYPFFPFVAGLVKNDFIWKGYKFEEGTLTLLDLYGTNHDPNIWENPDVFNPDRFTTWDGGLFDFIPQGGGDYFMGHRCAGEWVTIEIMKVSLDYLVNRINYDVPDQDLSFSMVSMPSIPRSKMVIKNISKRE